VIDGELGGRPGPECVPWNLRELRDEGVGAIVSLDDGVDEEEIRAAGILHLPAYRPMVLLETERDHCEFLDSMPEIAAFIDQCRREQRGVLVHCHYGCDRTGAVLACYLVAREGLDPFDAYQHVKSRNPDAFGAAGYAEAILTFHKILRANPDWLEQPK
jgi:protein-tyrosine phosphatase